MKKYRVVLLSSLAVVVLVGVAWAWTTFLEHDLELPSSEASDQAELLGSTTYRAMVTHQDPKVTGSLKVVRDDDVVVLNKAVEYGVQYIEFTTPTGTGHTFELTTYNTTPDGNFDTRLTIHWQEP